MTKKKNVAESLSGFLVKHAGELQKTTGVLRLFAQLIPVNPSNRANIIEALDGLDASAEAIAEAAPKVAEAAEVVANVKPGDVKDAVKALLPDALGGMMETAIRAKFRETGITDVLHSLVAEEVAKVADRLASTFPDVEALIKEAVAAELASRGVQTLDVTGVETVGPISDPIIENDGGEVQPPLK